MKLNINTMRVILVSALTLSMGSAFAASHSADGMKKMDAMNADGMQKMEGKMDEMKADGMNKMEGEMNADGMQKMEGEMNEMNADGMKKKMHDKKKEMNMPSSS